MPAVATQVLQAITLPPLLAEMSAEMVKVDTHGRSRRDVWLRNPGDRNVWVGRIIANEGGRFQAYGLRDGSPLPIYRERDESKVLAFLGDNQTIGDAKESIIRRAFSYRDTVIKAQSFSSKDIDEPLGEWRESVSKLRVDSHTITAISAQFVGPLLNVIQKADVFSENQFGGIHFAGDANSLAMLQVISASIWGASYSHSWADFVVLKGRRNEYDVDHSSAKLEKAMVHSSNTGIVMTSGERSGIHLPSDICSVFSGTGMNRADRDNNLIEPVHFNVFLVSFGLKSPTLQFVEAGGVKPESGVMHRILSIPVAAGNQPFDTDLARKMEITSGVPGKAFVDRLHGLAHSMPDFMSSESIEAREDNIRRVIGAMQFERPDTQSLQSCGRLSTRLAVMSLAGEMAYHLGVSPFPSSMVTSSVLACAIKALSDMDQNMPASCHYPDSIPLSQRSSAPSKRRK